MSDVNHTLLRQLRSARKFLQDRLDVTPPESAWHPNLTSKIADLTERIEALIDPMPPAPQDARPDPMPAVGEVWIHPAGYPVEVVGVVDPARPEDAGMRPLVRYRRVEPLDVDDQRLFGREGASGAARFVRRFSPQS